MVAPGWHVNANPASESYLIPTAIELDDERFALVEAFYPSGEAATFGFADAPLQVYDGEVALRAAVKAPEKPIGDVEIAVRVRYQACSDTECLEPAVEETSVRVRVLE